MGPDLARQGRLRVVDRDDLAGSSVEVARSLLGAILVRAEADQPPIEARIVETEGYDQSDPASHTHRGPTAGNATMFGPAGHAYVYFTYGMHHCVNVVCGPVDHGAAVLVRAVRVLTGHDVARARRPTARDDRRLADGPAKLTMALGIDRTSDGLDLCDTNSSLWLARDDVTIVPSQVDAGPRVGVRQAADRPWRFWIRGVAEVSAYRRHPRAPASPGR